MTKHPPTASPTVWRYHLRCNRGWDWAVIFLDSAGTVSLVSSYGDYGHHWSHPGMEFRAFLCGVGKDYLYGKLCLGRRQEFDGAASLRRVREHILAYRRTAELTADKARAEWDLAEQHLGHGQTELDAQDWYRATRLMAGDEYELLRYRHPIPHDFFEQIWLPFVEMLKADLQREAARTDVATTQASSTGPARTGQAETP